MNDTDKYILDTIRTCVWSGFYALEEVNEKIERPGADLLAPLWQTETAQFGAQDKAKWEEFAKWMQENGLLSADVNGAEAFTNKFTGSK